MSGSERIRERRARSTGTFVSIVRYGDEGYETICYGTALRPHQGVCFHPSLRLARRFASHPEEWCEQCAADAKEADTPL